MDDDADDDVAGRVPPLPPDDRLWRHPSEVSSWGSGGPVTIPAGGNVGTTGRAAGWPIALVGAVAGAAICGGLLAVTGHLSAADPQLVVEKVAVTPVVSSPMVRGASGVDALVEVVGPAVARFVVTTDAGTANASGVVVRDDGLLFASAHDVAGATTIVVLLADGRRFEGHLVGVDLSTDVAVVSIDADHLTVAVLGTSANLEPGTPTMAMGAPDDASGRPSVATGVVSALDRRLDAAGESMHGMIQTDAPIESGWSGGPLVDASGAVIGITTGLAGDGSAFGFATPIDLVRQVAEELTASGTTTHAWLGIEGVDLSQEQEREIGVTGGVLVRGVAGGSPAGEGGLAPGDVVTEIGDRKVSSSSALVVAMRGLEPGEAVTVTYWRDGDRRQATVTLGRRS